MQKMLFRLNYIVKVGKRGLRWALMISWMVLNIWCWKGVVEDIQLLVVQIHTMMHTKPLYNLPGLLGLPHETAILWVWQHLVTLNKWSFEILLPLPRSILALNLCNYLNALLIEELVGLMIPPLLFKLPIAPLPQLCKKDIDMLNRHVVP
jgi:hypothetical protein